MSGYVGYSKSCNAVTAETEGRFPLSKAANILAKAAGCSVSKAKLFLKEQGTMEWHHTSRFYNETKYYDVSCEAIPDLIEKIKNFSPDEKTQKQIFFKCWNMRFESDARKWEWSITRRDGKHVFSIDEAETKIKAKIKNLAELPPLKNKASIRVRMETEKALQKMLSAIEETKKT